MSQGRLGLQENRRRAWLQLRHRLQPLQHGTERSNEMIYIVKVDYEKFVFDDINTASSFAALAKNKALEPVNVTIELKFEAEMDK